MGSVVIHDFEIDVQREPRDFEPTAAEEAQPEQRPGAQEIERIIIRQQERFARVWAH
jgi:hypothetical protein